MKVENSGPDAGGPAEILDGGACESVCAGVCVVVRDTKVKVILYFLCVFCPKCIWGGRAWTIQDDVGLFKDVIAGESWARCASE